MRRTMVLNGVEYAPGQQFKVLAQGCTISGMTPDGPFAWSGWRQKLEVGDILTCQGYGPGWGSDPGYGISWTTEQSRQEGAIDVTFNPSVGGAFAYHPAPGCVEVVPND